MKVGKWQTLSWIAAPMEQKSSWAEGPVASQPASPTSSYLCPLLGYQIWWRQISTEFYHLRVYRWGGGRSQPTAHCEAEEEVLRRLRLRPHLIASNITWNYNQLTLNRSSAIRRALRLRARGLTGDVDGVDDVGPDSSTAHDFLRSHTSANNQFSFQSIINQNHLI